MNGRIHIVEWRETLEMNIKNQLAVPPSIASGDIPFVFVIVEWFGCDAENQGRYFSSGRFPGDQVLHKRVDFNILFRTEVGRNLAEKFGDILSLQMLRQLPEAVSTTITRARHKP